jgi:hypothetical protein
MFVASSFGCSARCPSGVMHAFRDSSYTVVDARTTGDCSRIGIELGHGTALYTAGVGGNPFECASGANVVALPLALSGAQNVFDALLSSVAASAFFASLTGVPRLARFPPVAASATRRSALSSTFSNDRIAATGVNVNVSVASSLVPDPFPSPLISRCVLLLVDRLPALATASLTALARRLRRRSLFGVPLAMTDDGPPRMSFTRARRRSLARARVEPNEQTQNTRSRALPLARARSLARTHARRRLSPRRRIHAKTRSPRR